MNGQTYNGVEAPAWARRGDQPSAATWFVLAAVVAIILIAGGF